jgi:mycothiol synthase
MVHELAGVVAPGADGAVRLASLEWRPLREADIPAVVRVLAAAEEVDRTRVNFDEADVRDDMEAVGFHPERHSMGAFIADGELACFGRVNVPTAIRDVDRVGLEGTVHPRWRRHGLGRRLLAWLEERGLAEHRARHPTVPGQLSLSVPEHVTDHVRLAERAGYVPVRWFNEMVRDLSTPVPPPSLPDGLRVVPFRPDLDEAVRHAHNEAFSEHWGSVERDKAIWDQWYTGSRAFQPQVSFVVMDGSEVAAYLLSYFWAADAEATGVREAWVGQLGTRAPWRGRGLGSALLQTALAAYRDAGYPRAALAVDTDNVTGALRLYERHGFVVELRRISYIKMLG